MKMVRMLLLAAASTMPAYALMQAYSVEPAKAACSGWTSGQAPGNRVSEIVTCCWDELDSTCYVAVFADCACAPGARV